MIAIFLIMLAVVAFGPTVNRLLTKAKHAEKLRKYAAATEPIFERSRFPGDQGVLARAQRHRELLIESGNEWPIDVFELYFSDAQNWGETWPEFEARCRDFETNEMRKFGARLRSANDDAYKKQYLRQS